MSHPVFTDHPANKIVLSWSGGKDSALALYRLQQSGLAVHGLLTTISLPYERISMHGVRRSLLMQQAEATGLPLYTAEVADKSNTGYETEMLRVFRNLAKEGIDTIAFGDIFLQDLRSYRENLLAQAGLKGIYPLWKENTADLAREFIREGFRTITCCVNDASLSENWCGRNYDEPFLLDLPAGLDPCGENGEFHTFCYDGPVFRSPVKFEKGEIVYRPLELKSLDQQTETKGFWYCDLF